MGDHGGEVEEEDEPTSDDVSLEASRASEDVNELEQKLIEDFKSFFNVDVTKQTCDVDALLSGILAKLEEFCTIIEMIRTESKDVLFTIAPVLHERCEEVKPLFQKIDKLEKFIEVVRACVDDADEKVRIAEKQLGSKNIKKILHNVPVPKFLLRKKEIQPYMKKDIRAVDYQVPKGFKTEDYFEPFTPREQSIENDGEVEV